MAGLGAKDILRNVSALEQLIEEINFQRAKEMRQCLMSKDSGRLPIVKYVCKTVYLASKYSYLCLMQQSMQFR